MIALALKLAASFFKIGMFTLGGGLAIIALARQETLAAGWLTAAEFADILGIAQSTPGPIGVNAATFAGYRVFANAGCGLFAAIAASLVATVSVMLPSVIGVGLGGAWFERNRDSVFAVCVFKILRPCVAGFVCTVGAELSMECLAGAQWTGTDGEPFRMWTAGRDIAMFAAAAYAGFSGRFSPVWVLAAAAAAGAATQGLPIF